MIQPVALLGAMLMTLVCMTGCPLTLEQRWEAFDADRRQEIGVKTTDYYLSEWGKPAKRGTTADGDIVWTWELKAYGGAQGWRKTLIFTRDGVLKAFSRDYWPKDN